MALYTERVRGSRARRGRLGRAGLRAHRPAPRRGRTATTACARSTTSARRRSAIDPVQKVYYCFGCQAAGDVFTFVQETEGVDFKGGARAARRPLRRRARARGGGPEREAERRRERERLLELLGAHERLLRALPVGVRGGGAARASICAGRGLGEEILQGVPRRLRPQRVGPRAERPRCAGGSPRPSCMRRGWPSARSRTGDLYDRFRARIMFPLGRHRAAGCSGSGRARDADEDQREPKYLNTLRQRASTTRDRTCTAPIWRARTPPGPGRRSSCEGYTDVIAAAPGGRCATRSG